MLLKEDIPGNKRVMSEASDIIQFNLSSLIFPN